METFGGPVDFIHFLPRIGKLGPDGRGGKSMRGRENSELTRALVRERVDSSILSGTPGKSRKIGTFYVANSSFPPVQPGTDREVAQKLGENLGKRSRGVLTWHAFCAVWCPALEVN